MAVTAALGAGGAVVVAATVERPAPAGATAPYDTTATTEIPAMSGTFGDMVVSPNGGWRLIRTSTTFYRSDNGGAWSQLTWPNGLAGFAVAAIGDDGTVYTARKNGSYLNLWAYTGGVWVGPVQYSQGSPSAKVLLLDGSRLVSVDDGTPAPRVNSSADGGTSWTYQGDPGASRSNFSASLMSGGTARWITSDSYGAQLQWSTTSGVGAVSLNDAAPALPGGYGWTLVRPGGAGDVYATRVFNNQLSVVRAADGTVVFDAITTPWSGANWSKVLAAPNGDVALVATAVAGSAASIYTVTFDLDGFLADGFAGTDVRWGPIHREDVDVTGSMYLVNLAPAATTTVSTVRLVQSGTSLYSVDAGGADVAIGDPQYVTGFDPLQFTAADSAGTVGLNHGRSPDGTWRVVHLSSSSPRVYRAHGNDPWELLPAIANSTVSSVAITNDGTVTATVPTGTTYKGAQIFRVAAGSTRWFGGVAMTSDGATGISSNSVYRSAEVITTDGSRWAVLWRDGKLYTATSWTGPWTLKLNAGDLYSWTARLAQAGDVAHFTATSSTSLKYFTYRFSTDTAAAPTTPPAGNGQSRLAVAGADSSEVWLVTPLSGTFSAWTSSDDGANWTQAVSGEALPAGVSGFAAVSVDANDGLHMYSSVSCGGGTSVVDAVRDLNGSGPATAQLLHMSSSTYPFALGYDQMPSDGPAVWAWQILSGSSGNYTLGYSNINRSGVPAAVGFGADGYGPMVGNVNAASGNFTVGGADVSIPAIGPSLNLDRTYNTLDTRVGRFGQGWSSILDTRLITMCPVNAMTVVRPDGGWEMFTAGANGWVAPPGSASTLEQITGGWKLTTADHLVTTFNSSGQITSTTDAWGRARTITYDGSNRPLVMTDVASGRTLTFGYNGSSTLVSAVSTQAVTVDGTTAPRTWSYGYQGVLLTSLTPPIATEAITYQYATTGHLVSAKDSNGDTLFSVVYRFDGRAATVTDGAGATSTYTYASQTATSVTDARDGTLTVTFDDLGRQMSQVNQAGGTTTYGYDLNGFLVATATPNGATTTDDVDATGRLVERTDPEGNVTRFGYDSAGDQIWVRDARSASANDDTYETTRTFNAYHQLLTETRPDGETRTVTYTTGAEAAVGGGTMPPGLTLTSSDFEGSVTTHAYAANGNLMSTTVPSGRVISYTYDQLGRPLTVTETSDAYPSGLVVSITAYDANGRAVSTTGAAVSDAVHIGVVHQARATSTFDVRGRNIATTLSDVGGAASASASRTTGVTFDDADRVVTVTDAEGGIIAYTYDDAGNIATVIDASGQVSAYTYDDRNQVVTVVVEDYLDPNDPNAAPVDVTVAAYTYDGDGNVATATDANGNLTAYTYDANGRVLTVTALDVDGNGHDVVEHAYTYDQIGNIVTDIRAGTHVVTYSYDLVGRVATETLEMGAAADRVVSYTYDANGNVTATTITDGARTEEMRASFDESGNQLSATVDNGANDVTTTYTYDQHDRRTSMTDPRGAPAHTTTYSYDEAGQLVAVVAPEVDVTNGSVVADAQHPTTRAAYNAFGDQTTAVDANGNETTITVDRLGRTSRVDHPTYTAPGASTPTTAYETWTYLPTGEVASHTDRVGANTTYGYDVRGRLHQVTQPSVGGVAGVTRTGYDHNGNVTYTIDTTGARTETTFDGLDRPITVDRIVRASGGDRHETTTYTYGDLGNLLSVTDPEQHTTSYTYNPAGEPFTVTDAGGDTTTTTRDVAGRAVTVTDPLGRSVMTTYDLAGRAITTATKAPDGATLTTTSVAFDDAGNIVAVTDPNGHSATYTYDTLGRIVTASQPTSTSSTIEQSWAYDAAGNVTRHTDGNGHTTATSYNSWGLVEDVVEPATTDDPNLSERTWTTSYDTAAQPVTTTGPDGLHIDRSFDALGRLTAETASATGHASASRVFGYDHAGQLTSVSSPAGAVAASYDDAGRITATAGATYSAATFGYDLAGRLTSRTDAAGTATFTWTDDNQLASHTDPITGATRTYTYDDAGQVHLIDAGTVDTHLSWDDLGRLHELETTDGSGTLTSVGYGYDTNSNITSKTTVLPFNSGAGTNTYTYDWANRLTSWTDPGAQTTSYGYDNASNRTSVTTATATTTWAFDERNRALSANGPDGHTVLTYNELGERTQVEFTDPSNTTTTTTYSYDAFGRTTSGAGVSYTYDALDRIVTAGTDTFAYTGLAIDPVTAAGYTYATTPAGAVVSATDTTSTAWIVTDAHDDITATITTTGIVAATTSYDPFGQTTATTGTPGPLGHQSDYTAHGTTWQGARWYQPATATYTSRDHISGTATQAASPNRYAYGWQNPLRYTDPTGHLPSLNDIGDTISGLFSGIADAFDPSNTTTDQILDINLLVTNDQYRDRNLGNGRVAAAIEQAAPAAAITTAIHAGAYSAINPIDDAYLLITGRDMMTGDNAAPWERLLAGAAIAAPIIAGAVATYHTTKSIVRTARNLDEAINAATTITHHTDNTADTRRALNTTTHTTPHHTPNRHPTPTADHNHPNNPTPTHLTETPTTRTRPTTRAPTSELTPSVPTQELSATELEVPGTIYREGAPSPSNLRVRPGEDALSFRDSLSNPWPLAEGQRPVFRPGEPYFGVETAKLPPGSVVPDGVPPGHVSVVGVDPGVIKDAVIEQPPWPRFPK